MSLLVVISSLEDRSAPFSQQALSHSLDARLRLLASCVKENNFSNSAAQQCFLFNIQSRQSREKIALDVVGW